jgi:hypothetical protein
MKTIVNDGNQMPAFEKINDARAWCYQFFKENPQSNLELELISGEVKGWVVSENGSAVWKKNCDGFCEYYTITRRGSLLHFAYDTLTGKELYTIATKYPPMTEEQARTVKRPEVSKARHLQSKGQHFQVIDTTTWNITRHGWTLKGILRYTDLTKEVIVYAPSRRFVEIAKK